MKKIFLTGGTGFLGSFIAAEMLKRGDKVVFLARSNKASTAERRIDDSLSFVDEHYLVYKDSYIVLEGDVAEPNCGLSIPDVDMLRNAGIDEIWHVAGNISFSEKKRDETYRVNVVGTSHMLELCDIIKPKQFHFTSTAYVCGDKAGTFRENDLRCEQRFYNPYERTKYEAEIEVHKWAAAHPEVRVLVFRPSIIVGDSRDGKIIGYSGYYTYMRIYHILKKMFSNGKREQVTIDGNGKIVLPVEVPGKYDSLLNIVTIDYAVDTMLKLAETGKDGTYNITPDNPQSYGFWLDQGTNFLGFTGVSVKNGGNPQKSELVSSVEAQITKGIADYIPYVSAQPLFDKSNVKAALDKNYKAHPEATPGLIATLLGYAVEHDFKE